MANSVEYSTLGKVGNIYIYIQGKNCTILYVWNFIKIIFKLKENYRSGVRCRPIIITFKKYLDAKCSFFFLMSYLGAKIKMTRNIIAKECKV